MKTTAKQQDNAKCWRKCQVCDWMEVKVVDGKKDQLQSSLLLHVDKYIIEVVLDCDDS